MQQADHAQQDRLRRLHRRPALCRRLVSILVVLGRVQDRDAEQAGRIDVWVERDRGFEGQGGREERVGWWKGENTAEITSCERIESQYISGTRMRSGKVGERTRISVPP